ncbi:GNAT family protein [Phyllobacterium sp. SB3]|uniref:GNAT family N-acetyltransferase n=1 Tax=Phyllobacterium sp. SB3 TaxID=3156073 RepID=UPI0032AFAC3A
MPPVLTGAHVKLRSPVISDANARFSWGTVPEIAIMFGVSAADIKPLTLEKSQQWARNLATHPNAWIIEHGGALIGEIRLDRLDMQDRRASMAIAIYDPSSLGRGLGTEAIKLVLAHAFGTMALHRIGIRVLAYNARAIRAYQKCGFVIEGRERDTAYVNGTWHDDIIMGLLEHEYEV